MELTYQDGFDDAKNGLCMRHFVYKTMPGGDRILTDYGHGWNHARIERRGSHVGRDWRYEKFKRPL